MSQDMFAEELDQEQLSIACREAEADDQPGPSRKRSPSPTCSPGSPQPSSDEIIESTPKRMRMDQPTEGILRRVRWFLVRSMLLWAPWLQESERKPRIVLDWMLAQLHVLDTAPAVVTIVQLQHKRYEEWVADSPCPIPFSQGTHQPFHATFLYYKPRGTAPSTGHIPKVPP